MLTRQREGVSLADPTPPCFQGRSSSLLSRGAKKASRSTVPQRKERPLTRGGDSGLAVLAGGVDRREIERLQAIGIAIVMVGAGGESTAALIGSAVRRLAESPAASPSSAQRS